VNKKYYLLIYVLLISISNGFAQNYRLFNVDASKFPYISADIFAYGADYNADSLQKKDIKITSQGTELNILRFKAPKTKILPLSIVFTLDVSSSMTGERLDVLKKTAKNFIQKIPLEYTEIAIVSYNSYATLKCDFTSNINLLNHTIDNLTAIGGTSFNNAFFDFQSGALSVIRNARYRKVIIFITDGLSKVSNSDVVGFAVKDTVIVNCITIGLPITEELSDIARETGGRYYENLQYDYQISEAFDKIYSDIEVNSMGKLLWKDTYSCDSVHSNIIKIKSDSFKITYRIPKQKVGFVEVAPSNVTFKQTEKNNIEQIYIRGNNINLNITSITADDTVFKVDNAVFPVRAQSNKWVPIQLSCLKYDSSYAFAKYRVCNPGCNDVFFTASTAGKLKLKITNPTQNDVYNAGDNISVRWKGINYGSPVSFYYRTKNNNRQIYLNTGIRYKTTITAPFVDGMIQITGKLTNDIVFANLMSNTNLIFTQDTFTQAIYSPDGKEILTVTKSGDIKTYNTASAKPNKSFELPHKGQVAYFNRFNRVLSFDSSFMFIYTNRNGMLVKKISLQNKKLLTSIAFIGGKEYYTSNFQRGWSVSFNYRYENFSGCSNSVDEVITPNGKFVVKRNSSKIVVINRKTGKKILTIKVSENFDKAFLHGSSHFIAVADNSNISVYNLPNAELSYTLFDRQFLQYDQSGRYLLTKNSDTIFINNIITGGDVFNFKTINRFKISAGGDFLACYSKDSLAIISLESGSEIYYSEGDIQQLKFFPKATKIALLIADSLKVINFKTRKTEHSVYAEQGLVKMFDISPDEQSLLITTNKIVTEWSIKTIFDTDTTPFFKINTSRPQVMKSITFGKQFVNIPKERFFDIVINNGQSKIFIDSIYLQNYGSPFSLVSVYKNIELAGGDRLPVEIRFLPTAEGIYKNSVVVNAQGKKYVCSLTGNAVSQEFKILSPVCKFKSINTGTKTDTVIPLIVNSGSEKLHIKRLFIDGVNSFTIKSKKNNIYLLTGDTLYAKVVFYPQQRGAQSAVLQAEIDSRNILLTRLFGVGLALRNIVIAGKTIDIETGKPLKSNVVISDLSTGREIKRIAVNSNGEFAVEVNTDFNYGLTGVCKGYFSSGVNIDLTTPHLTDTVRCIIFLSEAKQNTKIALNNIFFESGKANILKESGYELMRLVNFLKANPALSVEIHGHTDNIGTDADNITLSKQRAENVKNYLISKGISSQRVSIKYFGESHPVSDNNSPKGRKANRRVEIMFK